MILQPDQNDRRAYVIQEQISRTGVLLGRAFEQSETMTLDPVLMDSSRWTYLDDSREASGNFDLQGDRMGGDWFQSRREQSHRLAAIRPTRARIEQLEPSEDGSPRLFSSIEFPLKQIYYVDETGKAWKSQEGISAGSEITLTRVQDQDLADFWNNASEPFSSGLRDDIRELKTHRNVWLAVTEDPGDQMIPTLKSIRWKKDQLLLAGTPQARETSNRPSDSQ